MWPVGPLHQERTDPFGNPTNVRIEGNPTNLAGQKQVVKKATPMLLSGRGAAKQQI